MASTPSAGYFNSLVQVCRADGVVVGAGCIVDDRFVLTCAHVVALALRLSPDADAGDLPQEALVGIRRIYVTGATSVPQACRVEVFHGRRAARHADIARLGLSGDAKFRIDDDLPICRWIEPLDSRSLRVYAFGFPADARETRDQAAPAGYRITHVMPQGWLAAVAESAHGQEIRQGFSGAPVADDTTHELVGMVSEADAFRRTATIISTAQLREVADLHLSPVAAAARSEVLESPPATVADGGWREWIDRAFPRLYRAVCRLAGHADPPELAVVVDYLAERRAELVYNVQQLTYLPPPAKELDDLPVLPAAQKQRFFTPIQQLIKEIEQTSDGGDAASAQISALSRRTRVVRNLVRRLLTESDPLVVLGDPGSGKSMTLKQVAIALAERGARRRYPTLCVYVPLGRWNPVPEPGIADVERLVGRSVSPEVAPLLLPLAQRGRLAVIFDGMDEMSRHRYLEHTAALSKYAEKYRGQVRTLFSCRIADFSPAFRHRRLVLLPFQHRHIRDYLERQFGAAPMTVEGRYYAIPEVARRLASSDVPIDPHNPFSLWLICLYLQDEQRWPTTRVDLLRYYVGRQYDRKSEEAGRDGRVLPALPALVQAWSTIAMLISERNTGTDIGVHEVRALLGEEADAAISAGRTCGILQLSTDHDPPLVRFSHHRAQEYFTALEIAERGVKVEWAALLDVPRWQEVLVNVSQLPNGSAPLETLCELLNRIAETQGDKAAQSPERVLEEALATERIELGARVLHNLAPSEARDRLQEHLFAAARWMAREGNPVSQAKMLEVARIAPEGGLGDVIDQALESKIGWVRNQAILVQSARRTQHGGVNLYDEIVDAFSNGSALRSLGQFLRIGHLTNDRRIIGLAICVAAFFAVYAVLVALVVPLSVQFIATELPARMQSGWLGTWGVPVVWACTFLISVGALLIEARLHWIATPAIGAACYGLMSAAWSLLEVAKRGGHESLASTLFGAGFLFMFALLVCGLFLYAGICVAWAACLIVPACFARGFTTSRRSLFATFRSGFVKSGFGDAAQSLAPPLGWISTGAAIGLVFAGGAWAYKALPDWGLIEFMKYVAVPIPGVVFPFDLLCNAALLTVLVTACSGLLSALCMRRWDAGESSFMVAGWILGVLLILYVMYVVVPFTFNWLIDLLPQMPGFSRIALQAVAVALLGVIAIGLLLAIVYEIRWLTRHLRGYFESGSIAPSAFVSRLIAADETGQLLLLRNISAERLGMDARQFHDFLVNLQPSIKGDPASGAYFEKRAEVLAVLRQARSG